MNKGKLKLTGLLLLFSVSTIAQDIKITKFERNVTSIRGSFEQVLDNANEAGALIRFYVRDDGFVFEPNLGVLKEDRSSYGEVRLWVPKGTKRITVRHKNMLPLLGYEIPTNIESKATYDAFVKIMKKHYVYFGAGYNIVSINGPSLSFGANIKHHNLELEGIWGLNQSGYVNKYRYKAIRVGFRYGYEIPIFKYFAMTPEVGIAYTFLDDKYYIDSSSRIVGEASSDENLNTISVIGGIRLTVPITTRLKFCVTPEYNYGILSALTQNSAERAEKNRIITSNKTLESFFTGFNLNASLILFL